jgi:hypothetical protein
MADCIPITRPVTEDAAFAAVNSALTYGFCALRLQCNRAIGTLPAAPDISGIDVEIYMDPARSWPMAAHGAPRELWFTRADKAYEAESTVTVWKLADGAFFQICYGDGIEFLVDGTGTRIWAAWPDRWTSEDASTYLLGPVLGFVLRLRGITCLHASAIDVGREAVALVGPGGAGKSTTAAVFARAGYGILSDDLVALAEHGTAFLVQPAYPRVGLWPDSVEAVFGSSDLLPLQTPNWDKRYLDLNEKGYKFQAEPLPLRAIYVLDERDADTRAPSIEPLPPSVAVTRLIANAYVSHLLDGAMRARDFDVLARLASAVPVRRVVPHSAAAYLPKLRDVILGDVHDLERSTRRDARR